MFTEKGYRRSLRGRAADSQHGAELATISKLSSGSSRRRNAIIHGDNQAALNVLEDEYRGRVKCIYIDPPYNNLERYSHYEDKDSHKVWLSSVVSCVARLKIFLCEAGSIWISIDDRQVHYLKVALDDVFGRENFVSTIIWQQRTTRENRKVFSNNHEYILVYANHYSSFKSARGLLPWTDQIAARFKNPDDDPRGPWQSVSANAQAGHATKSQFYDLIAPNGKLHRPPPGRCWIYDERRMRSEIEKNNIWFGRDGNGVPRVKRFLSKSVRGMTPHTLWLADEVGTNDLAKKHLLALLPGKEVFDTPKPEGLIKRILEIATCPGEIVLDAYLGSGTTAAVAQKMNRRYIGIELGEHIITHCVARLRQVIAGEEGGISRELGWTGGGGYEFLQIKTLARS
jgi:adenine-specific DNA-methyltransferase